MIVVFDNNIVMDALTDRAGAEEARALIDAVADDRIVGVVTANSLTDIYYIARKQIGAAAARAAIQNLMVLFSVAAVDEEICSAAAWSYMEDFEDAVVNACAKAIEADYIVTRDAAFQKSEFAAVPVVSPRRMLEILERL